MRKLLKRWDNKKKVKNYDDATQAFTDLREKIDDSLKHQVQ